MYLNHPETPPSLTPVCGKFVLHKISPSAEKVGDCCSIRLMMYLFV